MVKHFGPLAFTQAHVSAIADLAEFQASRQAMLASTPILANPTLFERTQAYEDHLYARTEMYRGGVKNQRDSVNLDNMVIDEVEDRREMRRRVRGVKRAYLDAH